jgi:hypothetical protein
MTPSDLSDDLTKLREVDEQASVAHDYIWPQSKRSTPTREEASDAIWRIHELLRPWIDRLSATPDRPPEPDASERERGQKCTNTGFTAR